MEQPALRETILFVDDEQSILAAIRRGLFDEPYHCLFAQSGEEALALLASEAVAVIVTDMKMPKMDGLHLLRIVKDTYPDIIRIVLSGYTQLQQILTTINTAGVFKFIAKPWQMDEELKVVIQEALDFHRLIKRRDELETALKKQNETYQKMLRKHDALLENVTRQVAGVGDLVCDIFNLLREEACNVSFLPEALDLLGLVLRRYTSAAVSESDGQVRMSTDVVMLVRRLMTRSTRVSGLDSVPCQEVIQVRLDMEKFAAMADLLPELVVPHDASCHVRMASRTEAFEDRQALALSVLFLNPVGEIPSENPPTTRLARLQLIGQVMDMVMRTMNGGFQCRNTSVGVLCRFLVTQHLPAGDSLRSGNPVAQNTDP